MAYTAEGRRKRNNIERAANMQGLAEAIGEVMGELPEKIAARVKETGAGAQTKGGSPKSFSAYSDGWSEIRRRRGLQTSHKDFSFSGSFWESFKLKDTDVSPPTLTYTFGVTGTNNDSRRSNEKLAEIHSSPRGRTAGGIQGEGTNILFPNQEEMNQLKEDVQKVVYEYLANAFR